MARIVLSVASVMVVLVCAAVLWSSAFAAPEGIEERHLARPASVLERFSVTWNHLAEKRSQTKGASILSAPNRAQDAIGRFRIEWNHSLRRNRPLFRGPGILLAPVAARNALSPAVAETPDISVAIVVQAAGWSMFDSDTMQIVVTDALVRAADQAPFADRRPLGAARLPAHIVAASTADAARWSHADLRKATGQWRRGVAVSPALR